ncbi:salicylate synthetase [Apiospora arundinis]|uniref:Salicylate synthase n=1 Tax=Apiospora arundinis TaxID=335852 RepID=A0ABR2HKK3_9PEZI
MASRASFQLEIAPHDVVSVVCSLLAHYRHEEFYAYEGEGSWYIGIGNHASFVVDPSGRTATVSIDARPKTHEVTSTVAELARQFVSQYAKFGSKVFGFACFNYALQRRGLNYTPGKWPLISLMVPSVEVELRDGQAIIAGDKQRAEGIYEYLQDMQPFDEVASLFPIDLAVNGPEYLEIVRRAIAMIQEGRLSKVIASRPIRLPGLVDMVATLLLGRRTLKPRRSFSLNQGGFQATGFSPELVVSVDDEKVVTEPLAGTRAYPKEEHDRAKLRAELASDPKEIVEHVISVKEAVAEMESSCAPHTSSIEDFMSVKVRGSVQHLGSRVAGHLAPENDIWDALDTMFPSITASGIPKTEALKVIEELEDLPRELYSGAVLMIDGARSFEATLALRTIFQDADHSWVQAGAGITAQSSAERELTETCEKLGSFAPYVADGGHLNQFGS